MLATRSTLTVCQGVNQHFSAKTEDFFLKPPNGKNRGRFLRGNSPPCPRSRPPQGPFWGPPRTRSIQEKGREKDGEQENKRRNHPKIHSGEDRRKTAKAEKQRAEINRTVAKIKQGLIHDRVLATSMNSTLP